MTEEPEKTNELNESGALDSLSSNDKDTLRKLELAIRRRNNHDRNVHPFPQSLDFYAVLHNGKLLGVHEHDSASGLTPHESLRQSNPSEKYPDLLVDDSGKLAKPTLARLELTQEG